MVTLAELVTLLSTSAPVPAASPTALASPPASTSCLWVDRIYRVSTVTLVLIPKLARVEIFRTTSASAPATPASSPPLPASLSARRSSVLSATILKESALMTTSSPAWAVIVAIPLVLATEAPVETPVETLSPTASVEASGLAWALITILPAVTIEPSIEALTVGSTSAVATEPDAAAAMSPTLTEVDFISEVIFELLSASTLTSPATSRVLWPI